MPYRQIVARAPVRIDFAGAWTDVPKFANEVPGAVVNAAITLYTYVTVSLLPEEPQQVASVRQRVDGSSIHMYSADFDAYESAESIADIEYDGTMDLAKAACKRLFKDFGGFEIVTRSEAPPGSGLGTSASLGVALIGALMRYAGVYESRRVIADTAFRLETEELGLLSGTQDQYAAAFGGVSHWKCYGEQVFHNPIFPLDWALRFELEKRLVLCYTGKSRLSSDIHAHVVEEFDQNRNHKELSRLRYPADMAQKAFLAGDLNQLAKAMNMSWELQKALHPSITNDSVEQFFEAAAENGMQAGKACGAGGGGCLLFLAKSGQEYRLRRVLEEQGGQLLNFGIDDYGLVVWEPM